MKIDVQETIRNTFNASNEGRIHFGEVVANLMAAGVASYQVDYRAGRSTYHLLDDRTLDFSFANDGEPIANDFDTSALREAIQGAQQGRVMYPAFKRLSQRAGCIGYTVWIAGRHVTYFGRRGEVHVERFPGT
jgi:uncharacterized protein YbcV (DUF1398 family)